MDSLPLAQPTEKAITNYILTPSSVLILHGAPGVGKKAAAQRILASVLQIDHDKLMSYPYLTFIEPDKSSISIDLIREMQKALIRSVPGEKQVRRAVWINRAEALTTEAQNALLKSLEEAPSDTILVLCVDNAKSLLSTVVSRSRQLAVLPITETAAIQHFGDKPSVTKAYLMAGGRAELIQELLSDDNHPLLGSIDNAKDVLKSTPYERLLLVNNLSKDKPAAEELMNAILLLARISLTTSVNRGKAVQSRQWHKIIKQTQASQQALDKNAGLKLVLTDLFLHL